MRYLPIGLDLRDRDALVIGSGPELPSKIDRLLSAGARVTVIAAEPDREAEALASAGKLTLLRREAADEDLAGKAIVLAAPYTTPEGEARARRWHAEAQRRGALFCCVDRPEASTFVNAATADVEGVTLSVATDGASPGTARRIREDLEAIFADPRFARFVARLAEMRASLPRGERAARMAEAVKGFAIEGKLVFPEWFAEEDRPGQ
jgi:precorrin-2 dehydrogenase/sirohydrochlorin ferrochelatase